MKIAVITGASSGMGREFALQLCAQQSFDEVWLIARRKEKLEQLGKELNVPARIVALDLTSNSAFDEYDALLKEQKPEISVLVNASGYGKFEAFQNIKLNEQFDMIDLNDKALVAITYLSLPYMAKGSRVYQIGSLSSFQPVPYISVYGATKAFVLSFTRAVNAELRHTGIKMMAVCPGWVKTEFFDRAVTDESVITYYNKFFTSEQVVTRALKDMKKGKDVSVIGFSIRAQVLLTKLLPHRLVMKIWLMQQKKK
ncbi:MAG: SDR family NAD(P)-dependent oxidoreductase [Clostridia bacterium]|nr:SDR family NAD(P)-dependent oxidoreductase [Clostridia bacterium]